jgi:ectoine hydroxylase-related dioxygenase (phytanoyl-CoA dioxygenase family)
MKSHCLATEGFAFLHGVLADSDCEDIAAKVTHASTASAGTRCLLPLDWCQALAARLRLHPEISACVPGEYIAAQCTYFEKSVSRNWLVPIHQDLSIPVAERVNDASLKGWSDKEGSLFVQAPVEVLQRLVAVRLHLDACTQSDGPLQVLPGTHLRGRIEPEAAVLARHTLPAVACTLERGDALVMRPLLLHASSKASDFGMRRVLHFLFGPPDLPNGLRWQHAV